MKGEALRTERSGHVLRVIMFTSLRAFSLITLMLMAPLAGCFGENEKEAQDAGEIFLIDFTPAGELPLRSGE